MNYALDVMNNRITAISFLKEDSKDYMVGYKYMTIDINSAGIGINFNYLFPPETLDEIAGLTKEKSIKNLPVYQISTIIPRVDGGALMVAEYYDKTVENYEYTNYDPYYGYRTSSRQVEFYEYDDILLFSIQADGSPSWNNVIRKNNWVVNRGVNSSYAIIKGKERLIFVFNEDIEQNSNVLQYEVTADGTSTEKVYLTPISRRCRFVRFRQNKFLPLKLSYPASIKEPGICKTPNSKLTSAAYIPTVKSAYLITAHFIYGIN